jgi:hypothetical protein
VSENDSLLTCVAFSASNGEIWQTQGEKSRLRLAELFKFLLVVNKKAIKFSADKRASKQVTLISPPNAIAIIRQSHNSEPNSS